MARWQWWHSTITNLCPSLTYAPPIRATFPCGTVELAGGLDETNGRHHDMTAIMEISELESPILHFLGLDVAIAR